ncbi:MAG: hypothetical protein HRU19_16355 [Pseudobacteriovorax sp.]|nr:hypothetical protein [Pseudobacteriovorax sp.]
MPKYLIIRMFTLFFIIGCSGDSGHKEVKDMGSEKSENSDKTTTPSDDNNLNTPSEGPIRRDSC